MIRLYTAAYGNSGMNARQVLEEMVCDAMGEMNAFATEETSSVAGEVGQLLRDLRKAALETQTEGQKNNAQEGVKFSREMFDNAARQFDNEISQWDNDGRDGNRQFILGTTGEILQGLGAVENDIYMNGDKINTILEEHPEMTLSEIKQIPQILNDPTLILKSRNVGRRGSQNTRMILFGTAKAQNNLPIMVVFDVRPTEGHFVVTDMQKVTSAYTKTTDAVGFVKNSFVMYADKKRATPLLRTIGFHTPIELRQGGYVGSIAYNKQNVNLYGEEFSNVFREGTTKYSRELDSEYMELAKDPEGNRGELQEMVDQAAEAAGYEYKRNTRRKHSPANDVPWQMFVRGVDKYQGNYGDYTYYATDKGATSIDEIMPKLRELAEEFYGETVSDEEINPPDIVMSAGVWDDMDFVQYAWDNYFEGEMDRTGKVPAVVTEDGMIVIDEDFSRVKSGDTVEYDDNGKVIPLSERFNSDRSDIRYSRELETVEALKRQNELLQKQRDYWKEQTRTTDEKTRGADKGEVRSLAGQLIRQYSSRTEVEEILPEMQWLADSIWRNDPKISYTDLQDSAQNIARMVLDGSEVNLNAENWETGQELKRFLRGRYINVDESLKEDIGDFKNFRRSNRSLHFRENGTGTGVASLWLELQNDFGKGLFPDSISNPGDQIRHIADTLTSLTESDMRNPYAADMELTVEQMAYDVMARAAGLNRQKATKTDNTADSPLLYSVRMLTWAEVSWSMLPSS